MADDNRIGVPPTGLAILAAVGPGLVWCSEMIGSGEVIIATRTGAILGMGVMWAVVLGVVLKCWIGVGGARYTVCTGEGMIDMFDRIPGPRHWVVWLVLVVHFMAGATAMGALSTASGHFLSSLVPVIPPRLGGWIVCVLAFAIVWSGKFKILKIIMSMIVLVMILGVLYVAVVLFPGFEKFMSGFVPRVPPVPEWAILGGHADANPWLELLPLMGWAAGGFASQVWYTYWVLGAGYGAAKGRGFGKPADTEFLKNIDREGAERIKGWCRVVTVDASVAMVITTVLTICFLMAGAIVLGANELAPEKSELAMTLSKIFSSEWGAAGGFLFLLTGTIALSGTLIGQLAGWPRLLADTFRICIPGFDDKLTWKQQFRSFMVFFLITNMTIVHMFDGRSVFLVKMGAIIDGLLLTPLQALWVAAGLFIVLPKLVSKETYSIVKPHWSMAVILILAFLVFGYFCVFQIPHSVATALQP